MKSSLLIATYQRFSTQEMQQLGKFIASPYFNESNILIQFHEYLSTLFPAFSEAATNKAKVYQILYPGEKYDDLKLRYFRARLLKLVERFLSLREYEQNNLLVERNLLASLSQKKNYRLFSKKVKTIEQVLEQNPRRDAHYYLEKFILQEEVNKHLSFASAKQSRSIKTANQNTIESLDIYYLINKLRYFCTALSNENVLAFENKHLFYDEIIKLLETSNYKRHPAISIYHSILRTLKEPENESHFKQLEKLLNEHYQKFSAGEVREMFVFAQNYCIKKINFGESRYLKELFTLYKRGLEKELILDKGQITPWTYKNITVLGLRLDEFDWVANFIENYKKALPQSERENAYTYNLAKYYFYREAYSKVITLLMRVTYDDVFYGLDSKAMLLKTYYELDEREALYSICDSFRIFLKRKKVISEHHRLTYMNLIKFVKKLSRVLPGDRKKITAIEKDIQATKQIADVNWLMEKVKELKF